MSWFTKLFTKKPELLKTRWSMYQTIDAIIKEYYDTDEEKICARRFIFSDEQLDKLCKIEDTIRFVADVTLILDFELNEKGYVRDENGNPLWKDQGEEK